MTTRRERAEWRRATNPDWQQTLLRRVRARATQIQADMDARVKGRFDLRVFGVVRRFVGVGHRRVILGAAVAGASGSGTPVGGRWGAGGWRGLGGRCRRAYRRLVMLI